MESNSNGRKSPNKSSIAQRLDKGKNEIQDSKRYYKKSESIKILEEKAFQATKEKYPSVPYPKQTKYRDDTANGLTKAVIDWLRLEGWQAERINCIGQKLHIKGRETWIPSSGQKGTADISATIKGRSVKLEIKCAATGDKYQSYEQKLYQKEVERSGGIYGIVRDFEGFYTWYQNFVK